jgi:predicted transposase/invertase (TIGR01784 family)
MRLLDPKLDVVFKMLFADERNRELLCSLLSAVLDQNITDVEVLNPDIPKETVAEKGAVLDIRARLKSGERTNIEMQTTSHPGLRQRVLYYWSRSYTSQLGRGDRYFELAKAVSIFILNFEELTTSRYHNVFRVLEIQDHVPLSDDLCIHVLELPKLPRAPAAAEAPPVLRWGRFFAAKTDTELEQLAMIDPDLERAKTALERLSADPAAQELARERELAAWNYERGLRLAHKEGHKEGRMEGKVEGERVVLRRLLSRKFGELPESVRARLEQASIEELERWTEQLLNASSLEEALS